MTSSNKHDPMALGGSNSHSMRKRLLVQWQST